MAYDEGWMSEGSCADLPGADKIFFPVIPQGSNGKIENARAKAICKGCPVRLHCLSYAIAHKIPYGVWGGLSARERGRISKDQRRSIREAWRSLNSSSNQMKA